MTTSATLRPGLKLMSATCDTELIVIRATGTPLSDVTCGGAPVRTDKLPVDQRLPLDPEASGGTQLGKRYVDDDGTVELLCTRPGSGSLALAGQPLQLKAAKPLPASD